MKTIIFKIDDEGEVSMEVQGAVGASCDDFSAPFEEILGNTAKKERKPEFYNTEEIESENYGENHG